ncbi:hypothetical protein ACFOSD_04105 [Salinispirillum marinum]|uniref:Solute-binding protein family 3/N-terminal domain-containing protein n=2 Tax=Saccharospirillaceae TaxID=255527 RepID=A0ABV8BE65_9GAMM
MLNSSRRFFLTLLCVLYSPWLMADNVVLVSSNAFQDYERFLNGRDPVSITDFSGPYSRRDVVEMVLVKQALHLSGVAVPFTFAAEDDPDRIIEALRDGSALAAGNTFWLDHLTPHYDELRITTALINRGEFEVGFYVHPDAVVRENSDLRSRRQISTAQWKQDWDSLHSLGFDALLHWDTWPDQVNAVMTGDISFLLAPFQNGDDMVLQLGENRLVPIPGIKLGLIGSRHMAVSRAHPDGALFNSALQLGLLRLKREDRIRQAYLDSGFLHPGVTDWVLINAPGTNTAWQVN